MTTTYTLNGFRITENDQVADGSEGEAEEVVDFRPAVLTLQFPSDVTSISYVESVFTYPRGSNLDPGDPSETDIFIEIPATIRIAIDGENINLIHRPLEGLFEFGELEWSAGTSQLFGFYYDDSITGSFFDNEFSYDYVFAAAGAELPDFDTYDSFVAWAEGEGLGEDPTTQPTGAFAAGEDIPLSAFRWDAVSSLNDPLNLVGSESSETLFGGTANDTVDALSGDDVVRTDAGDDTIEGAAGDDTLDGGAGVDTAVYGGAFGNYVLTIDGTTNTLSLSDKRADGTGDDTLELIELLQFGDGFSFNDNGVFDLREITGAVGLSEDMLLTFVEMYVAYFDRAPDALGLNYWGTRLADGMGLGEIAQSFFFQEETFALYPELEGRTGVDDPSSLSVEFYTRLVTDTYDKLLEREPDDAGEAFWIGELQNGNVNLGEFVLAIINGARDFNSDGATPEQIAQAALDTRTVEEKGQLGYAFAVEGGMNNVANAREIMGTYDIDDRAESIGAGEALIAEYRALAEAADSTEIVLQITNLGEDPLAIT